MAGVAQIPWYATTFRADKFAQALELIAPLALRFGATEYRVYRNRDDRYKFTQMATFEDHLDFERYWYGEEFVHWRADRPLLERARSAAEGLVEYEGPLAEEVERVFGERELAA